MAWKKNKRLLKEGFADLEYVPVERCGWDCTVASLAYAARLRLGKRIPDLGAWAVRHGLPASSRYAELADKALVLWHGTSETRALQIEEHGLFSKGGVWATINPFISHGFCRSRADRFGAEGAVICLVLDRDTIVEGADYEMEGDEIYRFHHRIGPAAVEYILTREQIRFTGTARAMGLSPWPSARFKRQEGDWVPLQKAPVRYSEGASYSSVPEFLTLCAQRLIEELGEVTALEVFSTLYACIRPWDALRHEDVIELLESCTPARRFRAWPMFR